jgi:hypothetical protein
MLATIDNCGIGIAADLSPEELGNGVWSTALNVRFNNGYAERFKGTTQAFDTPAVTPYFLAPYATTTARFWIHAGLSAVYADDGTTRTDITGTAPTGAIDDRWTGGSINGVWVMNNGVDVPMYWNGDTGTNLASLGGWDANWRATSVRPFKNFIVALGITKSGTKYPHMVKWCTTLNPGAVSGAGDWDETNPAKDAGEQDLAETPDIIVDCLPLGDVNIIYKERSAYAMTYVGAPFIFRFQRLPGDSGMLARGCGVQTPLGHVVLSAGDVVVNTGSGSTSIANGLVRKFIFNNINSTYYKRSFVTTNPQKNEVWICFPFGESETCNRACVWNWIDKTWAIRELQNVTYGAAGQANITATGTTWAGDSASWASDATSWNENEYSPAEARLLMSHTTPVISVVDTGTSDFGELINANITRTGMHFGDPYSVKTITGVRPKFDGPAGTLVTVEIGASMFPDASPIWSAPTTFTLGQSIKIDSFATGRFLAIRFSNADFATWRIKSFDIEYIKAGAF